MAAGTTIPWRPSLLASVQPGTITALTTRTSTSARRNTKSVRNSTTVVCYCYLVLIVAFSVISMGSSSSEQQQQEQEQPIYGTQCSFPITGKRLDGCDSSMQNHRKIFYNHFMRGCYHRYSKQDCSSNEHDRFEMNRLQPQSMINMTDTGYRKIRAPDSLIRMLTEFYEANKEDRVEEEWSEGETYTNHWDSPTYMVSVEEDNLEGGGPTLKKAIWDAAIDGIAEWTGGVAKLRPVSLYGIREYTEGSILTPHVDRNPLVSSGIVNVAQDVDEPWPLEVYDRNGHAKNITMEPGDMVLYESHSLIHGRPFPMKGRFYANIFIHFEPFDGWETARDKTNQKLKTGENKDSTEFRLPPYILPGSPGEKSFREENPNGWFKDFAEGDEPPVGQYASDGSLHLLQEAAAIDHRLLWFQDEYGWAPIHEAIRGGRYDVVKYLVENGADINSVTWTDASPLGIAKGELGPNHEITKYLEKLGAEDFGLYYDGEYNEAEVNNNSKEDSNVPTTVPIDEEIVPTIVRLEEKVPEIVPAIVWEDDDEEL